MAGGRLHHHSDWRKYVSRNEDNPLLRVKKIDDYIGKGVFTRKVFEKGEFLLEYAGELISRTEGKNREEIYPDNLGSFLYFFTFDGKKYCVDATFSKRKARYVNDSPQRTANAVMKVKFHESKPILCLFAKTRIQKGTEIRYDYGVNNLPWRKKVQELSSQSDDASTLADKNCSSDTYNESNINRGHPDDASMLYNDEGTSVQKLIMKKSEDEENSHLLNLKMSKRNLKRKLTKIKASDSKKVRNALDPPERATEENECEEVHVTSTEEIESATYANSYENANADDYVLTEKSQEKSVEDREAEREKLNFETDMRNLSDLTQMSSDQSTLEKSDEDREAEREELDFEAEIRNLSGLTQKSSDKRTLEISDVEDSVITQHNKQRSKDSETENEDEMGQSTSCNNLFEIEARDLSKQLPKSDDKSREIRSKSTSRLYERSFLNENSMKEKGTFADGAGKRSDKFLLRRKPPAEKNRSDKDILQSKTDSRQSWTQSMKDKEQQLEVGIGNLSLSEENEEENEEESEQSSEVRQSVMNKRKERNQQIKSLTAKEVWTRITRRQDKPISNKNTQDKTNSTTTRDFTEENEEENEEESEQSSEVTQSVMNKRKERNQQIKSLTAKEVWARVMRRQDKPISNKNTQEKTNSTTTRDVTEENEEENEEESEQSSEVRQSVMNKRKERNQQIKSLTAKEVWARVMRRQDKPISNKNTQEKTNSTITRDVTNEDEDQRFEEAVEKKSKDSNTSATKHLNSTFNNRERQSNGSFAQPIELSSECNDYSEKDNSVGDDSYQSDESEVDDDDFSTDKNWKHICRNRNTSQLEISSSSGDSSSEDLNENGDENISSEKNSTHTNHTKKRKKMICYVCEKHIYHLLRHLRQVHGKDVQGRCANVQKSEAGYIYRICPIKDCKLQVARLRPHLREIHNLSNSEILPLLVESEKVTEKHSREKKKHFKRNVMKKVSKERPLCSIKMHKSTEKDSENNSPSDGHYSSCQKTDAINEKSLKSTIESTKSSPDGTNSISQSTRESTKSSPDETNSIMQSTKESTKSSPDETSFMSIYEFREFIAYLEGPGPWKSKKNAFQHARQVFTIWRAVTDGSSFSPKYMLNMKRIKSHWLSKHVTTWTPGTTKSYLCSLIKFLEFCITQDVEWKNDISPAINELQRLNKDMRKKTLERRSVVECEDANTLIDATKLQTFLNSDITKQIEHQLNSGQFRTLQKDIFVKIRNYLMLRILFANGQRPGALLGITPKVIRNAREEDGGATLMVPKHKTAFMGPAALGIPEPLWTWLKKYMHYLNFQQGFSKKRNDDETIFVTYTNFKALTSSLINKGIQNLWYDVMGKDSPPITATKIRKSIVTNVRRICPTSRDSLASHMSHQAATADRYYNISSKVTNALSMSKFISSTMTTARRMEIKRHESQAGSNKGDLNDTQNVEESKAESNKRDLNDIQNIEGSSSATDENSSDRDLGDETNKGNNNARNSEVQQSAEGMEDSDNFSEDNDRLEKNESYNGNNIDKNDASLRSSEDKLNESDDDTWTPTRCTETESSDCHNLTEQEEIYLRHGRRSFLPEDTAVLLFLCKDIIKRGEIRGQNILLTLNETKEETLIDATKLQIFLNSDIVKQVENQISEGDGGATLMMADPKCIQFVFGEISVFAAPPSKAYHRLLESCDVIKMLLRNGSPMVVHMTDFNLDAFRSFLDCLEKDRSCDLEYFVQIVYVMCYLLLDVSLVEMICPIIPVGDMSFYLKAVHTLVCHNYKFVVQKMFEECRLPLHLLNSVNEPFHLYKRRFRRARRYNEWFVTRCQPQCRCQKCTEYRLTRFNQMFDGGEYATPHFGVFKKSPLASINE